MSIAPYTYNQVMSGLYLLGAVICLGVILYIHNAAEMQQWTRPAGAIYYVAYLGGCLFVYCYFANGLQHMRLSIALAVLFLGLPLTLSGIRQSFTKPLYQELLADNFEEYCFYTIAYRKYGIQHAVMLSDPRDLELSFFVGERSPRIFREKDGVRQVWKYMRGDFGRKTEARGTVKLCG